jgi:hypothetical protein
MSLQAWFRGCRKCNVLTPNIIKKDPKSYCLIVNICQGVHRL